MIAMRGTTIVVRIMLVALVASILPATASPVGASHDGEISAACPRDRVPWGGFDDNAEGTHRFTIDCVAWWGTARGVAAHRYEPHRLVRRDQMASFIARMMEGAGYRLPSSPERHFTDIRGNTHELRIHQLAEVGVVRGTGGGRFTPSASVTRAQMATFIVRGYETATGTRLSAASGSFDDVAGNPHEESINKAAEAGIAQGTAPRRYDPAARVHRAQMATFVARTLDTLVENGHATPPPGPASRPAEPMQSGQWALGRIGASPAWRIATGGGTVIAIVDTGVDPDHPELRGRLIRGASWIDCDGEPIPCDAWQDANGHGTHVAGIAAAPRDGRGIAGVAPDAMIMPVRVLDASGSGSSRDVAAGIRYAADNGADVINLSLAGQPVVSQIAGVTGSDGGFAEAISYAVSRGVLVVAAAGNDAAPICSSEAFQNRRAVCVGATDRRDVKSAYSNFGGGLDVMAPGGTPMICSEQVLSTYTLGRTSNCGWPAGYAEIAGTSMSAPHVSGIGALLAEIGVRGERAAARIAATAKPLGGTTYDPVHGYGLVDAVRAVRSS